MRKVKVSKIIRQLFIIGLWLSVWQLMSSFMGSEILIPSPIAVVKALFQMSGAEGFWSSIWFTISKILTGFLLAMILGVIMGIGAAKSTVMREVLDMPMTIIKSVPVASFIIVALIWFSSENLSIFISFLMVLPIFYINSINGIAHIDEKLLEMSKVFSVGILKKIRYIYIPGVMPYFISAANVSLGLCWKAGIAAEVIAIPSGSIGEKLYQSKIFLDTKELFAWTIVIIFVSIIFEKVFLLVLKKLEDKLYW